MPDWPKATAAAAAVVAAATTTTTRALAAATCVRRPICGEHKLDQNSPGFVRLFTQTILLAFQERLANQLLLAPKRHASWAFHQVLACAATRASNQANWAKVKQLRQFLVAADSRKQRVQADALA